MRSAWLIADETISPMMPTAKLIDPQSRKENELTVIVKVE